MNVVQTTNIFKIYGNKTVVSHLNMCVQDGDIYGFIGKNGSGKSTTLKMLCGISNPSGGEITLFDRPITDEVARHRIGVLIETVGVYPNKSALENMLLKAYCFGVIDAPKACRECLELVGLSECGRKPVKHFSMGMKQRLGIAMALMGNPDLLLLDEPINGLDPEGIIEIRELLLRLNRERGITMVISSHILGELSKIATRYGILNEGQLMTEITAGELQEQCRECIVVKTKDARRASAILEQEANVHKYEVSSNDELRIFDNLSSAKINGVLSDHHIEVSEVYSHHQDLEEYFMEMTGGEKHV